MAKKPHYSDKTKLEVVEYHIKSGNSLRETARNTGISRNVITIWLERYLESKQPDAEIVAENVRLSKRWQAATDRNRIANKSYRENARIENALEAYSEALRNVFEGYKLHKHTKQHKSKESAPVGVVHLTDLHFNELVELPHNQYDFTVAGKRIQKLVERARALFKSEGISEVVVAFTGDLMNSDRRLDELLCMATNRARATFCAVDILKCALQDLNKDFNLTVGWVNGNEGRITKDVGFIENVASDNYDETIMRMLSYLFRGCEGVKFLTEADSLEVVIDVNGSNLLLVHGHCIGKDHSKDISKIRSKYITHGVQIDYIIFGHIHETHIADFYARSASPVGANAYSERGLNLPSRAAQNLLIFRENTQPDVMRVDLQNVDGFEGYKTHEELHAYNIKSADKNKRHVVIHEIII